MTRIDGSRKTKEDGAVSKAGGRKGARSQELDPTKFQRQLKAQLEETGRKTYREKDLFAALVREQLQDKSGDRALDRFNARYDQYKSERTGTRAIVYATNRALKSVREEGLVERETAHGIRSQAFGAAQMDFNPFRLGTSYAEHDQAYSLRQVLDRATAAMTAYDNGSLAALSRGERRELLSHIQDPNKPAQTETASADAPATGPSVAENGPIPVTGNKVS